MNPVLYTGTGSELAVTGVNFQPDFTWIKNRDTTDWNRLLDSVRGATKELYSNSANTEDTQAQSLKSFDSDGFTLGTLAEVNTNTEAYVSWNWKAGGTAVSNTAGSITSSVSANTDSGFSIVTWTGTGANATVGHGLGSVPKMIILKNRDSDENWIVGNTSLGWTKYLSLNTTDSVSTVSNIWQDTTPTSSVFSIGASGKVNGSSNGMVVYAFADVKGFSKFGSYVGNGSTDGTFVYTGFKPSWLMVKRSSTSGTDWYMFDNKRNTFNVTNSYLDANTGDAEVSNISFDFTSNGFKLRDSQTIVNGSGSTFIYMAFAENPLVANTSGGIPTTAR